MPPSGLSLVSLARSVFEHQQLIGRLVKREVTARVQGSVLGLAWMVLTPLLTAAVFTFVFSAIFQARWGLEDGGTFSFAIILLVGLAVHGIFAEAIGRAPTLIINNASYVTKVVFPLEILPVVALLTSLVNAGISLLIVVLGQLLLSGVLNWTLVFLPLVILPYLVFVLALLMFFAACGVFLRDLAQVVTLLVTVSLFLTPIFYPLTAVPPAFQAAMRMNPLTLIVEQGRAVVVQGVPPDFLSLAIYMGVAVAALAASFWFFQRLRPGFADVL